MFKYQRGVTLLEFAIMFGLLFGIMSLLLASFSKLSVKAEIEAKYGVVHQHKLELPRMVLPFTHVFSRESNEFVKVEDSIEGSCELASGATLTSLREYARPSFIADRDLTPIVYRVEAKDSDDLATCAC